MKKSAKKSTSGTITEQEKFLRLARVGGFSRRQGLFLWNIAVGDLPDYRDESEAEFMERAFRVTTTMSPKRKRS